MIEVAWEQGQKIRELVAEGMDPDEAYRKATQAKVPKVKADVVVENTPKKKHKYGAIPTEIDGHRFASRAEARRYEQLKLMRDQGIIRDLVLQPRYPIKVNGALICTYVGDFRYFDNERGAEILEDVKGYVTKEYKLKKKLMRVVWGIDIVEVSV